jgi:DNA-nicking Smr family endonuclease
MSEEKPQERKLALHEYPRDFTEEQLNQAARLIAQGSTYAAVSRELSLSIQRATTLCKKAEVLNTALRLRETKLIPDALIQLHAMTQTMQDLILDMNKRLIALEVAHGRVTKAIVHKRYRAERDRETIKKLRNERKELRDLIRKRGIV